LYDPLGDGAPCEGVKASLLEALLVSLVTFVYIDGLIADLMEDGMFLHVRDDEIVNESEGNVISWPARIRDDTQQFGQVVWNVIEAH